MSVPSEKSVTQWIEDLKVGDAEAARTLNDRYFTRLVEVARSRLGNAPRRVADEEDVALSVFKSLCNGAAHGHFPDLADRDDLWRLLLEMTHHKVVDQIRYNTRQKRGGGQVRGDSILIGSEGRVGNFDQFIGEELTPEFLAMANEQYLRLLELLPDDTHRNVALWRMEGFTNRETAEKLGVIEQTVERKLANIRKAWSKEVSP